MWISLLFLSSLGLGMALSVPSAEAVVTSGSDTAPASTTITAKKMTVRNQEGQALFEGSVVLTKGTLVVYSDKMLVLFHPTGDGANGTKSASGEPSSRDAGKNGAAAKGTDAMPSVSNRSMSQIEATGRVKIVKENGNATCGRAVYMADTEVITLTENPVAWEKGTRVSGKKITMYLKEDRSVVEGGTHLRMDDEEKPAP